MRGVKWESIDLLEKEDIFGEQFFHLRMDDLKLFLDRGMNIVQYSIIARLWEEKWKVYLYTNSNLKYCILYIVVIRDTSGLGSDTSSTNGTSGDGTSM